MDGSGDGAMDFMQALMGKWGEQARSAQGSFREQQRQMLLAFRDLLDSMEQEDTMEREWARAVQRMFLESLKSQREARSRFIQAQRSLMDDYLSLLDSFQDGESPGTQEGHEGDDGEEGDETAAGAES